MSKADRYFGQGALVGVLIGLFIGLLVGLAYPPSQKDKTHYYRLGVEAACNESERR